MLNNLKKIFNKNSTSIDLSNDEEKKFNYHHELYFKNHANFEYESGKPFGNYKESASILFQMGLLFEGSKIGRSQKIGEIGCGGGWLSHYISRLNNEVHIMDISPSAIKMAKKLFKTHPVKHSKVFFHLLKNNLIDLPDNSLDRIVFHDTLHHIPRPLQVLKECNRVLKEGGILGLSECGPLHSKIPAIIDCREKTGILERDLTFKDLKVLAKNSGFHKVTIKPYPSVSSLELSLNNLEKSFFNNKVIVSNKIIADSYVKGDQTLAFFHKGKFSFDTRYPNNPKAKIQITEKKIIDGNLILKIKVKNIGDTIFLTKPNELGGFCKLGAHLLKDNGEIITFDFIHQPLDNYESIKVGKHIDVDLKIDLKNLRKNYIIELDLIIEGVCWLAYMGSKTSKLHLNFIS